MLDEFCIQHDVRRPKPNDKEYKNFNVHKHGITVDKQFLDTLKGKEYLTSSHIKFFTNLLQHYFDPQKEILVFDSYFFSDFMPHTTIQIQLPQCIHQIRNKMLKMILNQLKQQDYLQQIKQKRQFQQYQPTITVDSHADNIITQTPETIQEYNQEQAQTLEQPAITEVPDIQEKNIAVENNSINSKVADFREAIDVDNNDQQGPEHQYQSDQQTDQTTFQTSLQLTQILSDNTQIDYLETKKVSTSEQISLDTLAQPKQQFITSNQEEQFGDQIILENQGISQLQDYRVEETNYSHDFSAITDRQRFLQKTYNCQSENPLTEKKFTYFPINIHNDHWICVIIFNDLAIFQYLDSLNQVSNEIVGGIRQLLNYKSPQRHWKMIAQSPRQYNGYDCGAFCIMAYYQLVKNQHKQVIKHSDYNAKEIEVFRKKLMTLAVVACQAELNSEIIDLIFKT